MLNKSNSLLPIFSMAVAGLLLASCASPRFSPQQEVEITSEPSGAEVMIGARSLGTTPLVAELNKQVPHVITVRHPGYRVSIKELGSIDREEGRVVSFGPLRDAGYYRALETDHLHFELTHRAIPEDPAERDRAQVEETLDQAFSDGEMNLLERLRLQRQVDSLYR